MNREETKEALRRELVARRLAEEAEEFSGSLVHFVRAGWEHLKPEVPYVHNWHIDAICEHLEAVSHGEIKRLQIWIPPQSMKSILASVCWPAWEWTYAPGMSYWTASYSTDLSGRLSAMSMLLMKTPWYQDRWGGRFKFIRDAEQYRNQKLGQARGEASKITEGAKAYKARVVAEAQGEAQRFVNVYNEYAKAPEVTRQRMYLETMQQIYANTSKVLVDAKGQGNLLYLPLDKLMQAASATTAAQAAPEASVAPSTARPMAPLSSVAPPQLENAPTVGGGAYSSSSRDGSLRSRDREGR